MTTRRNERHNDMPPEHAAGSDEETMHALGGFVAETLASKLQTVDAKDIAVDTSRLIQQANAFVVPVKLRRDDEAASFVFKHVDISKVVYRDDEHRERTRRSYACECAFYALSPRVDETGRCIENFGDEVATGGGEDVPGVLLADGEGSGNMFTIVAQDLGNSIPSRTLGMNAVDATDALKMLARFHARWWRGLPDSPPLPQEFWPLGGYWTLDKRQGDLDKIESNFQALCDAFQNDDPDELIAACRRGELGKSLRRDAHAFHRLSSSCAETVVHGDFKAANIIRDAGTGRIKMIDFQWCGPGSPARDLAYYFYTSASREVLAEKDRFIKLDHDELIGSLRARGSHEAVVAADTFTLDTLEFHLLMHDIDYTRFTMGAMWGTVTPATLAQNADSHNQGMHKRSRWHLHRQMADANTALGRMDSDSEGLSTQRLVSELLGVCVALADEAGDIVRSVAAGGSLGRVRDKSDKSGGGAKSLDPQTQADRRAERLIVATLRNKFGDRVNVLGEEALEGALTEAGSVNADGTIDEDDEAISVDVVDAAAELVKPIELHLPPGVDADSDDICVWVDPLDGTREYVEGPEHWSGVTVLMGISVGGVPTAGVIHQPFVNHDGEPSSDPKCVGRTLWGGYNMGVWSSPGRKVSLATRVPRLAPADPMNLRVATTRSHPGPAIEKAIESLAPAEVVRAGGAGGKVALILDGRVDAWIFPQKGTKRWDTCAGEALLRAHHDGWLVNGTDGQSYDYSSEVRTSPGNVEGVMAAGDPRLFSHFASRLGWR